MLANAKRVRAPLPKGWPSRVRSAVVHATSMCNVVFTVTRSHGENHFNARVRIQAQNDRLRREVSLLTEELRIKDSRMERIPPQRRPHYPPVERLAILELRAARGWSLAQTARRLLVTPLTVTSWTKRLDDEGPTALVQLREPVNRFPEFVRYLVHRLKVHNPAFGSRRIARVLARAGLHLGATTVRRMLRPAPKPVPRSVPRSIRRIVSAKRPNHVWHADLTTVPTSLGYGISWLPFALPQRWPFCWWVAVVVDHYSRRALGAAVFKSEPAASDVIQLLGRLCRSLRCSPDYLITDQGTQFTADAFRSWCRRRGIRQRFGAVGRYGSIAVVERFIRSMKSECTRAILVPFSTAAFERELHYYVLWFNENRPHERFGPRTPNEIYFGRMPAARKPRFEPQPAGHVGLRVHSRRRSFEAGRVRSSSFASRATPGGSISRSSHLDRRLDEAAVAAVEALVADDEVPWWIPDALRAVFRRYGDSDPSARVELLGDTFDDRDAEKVRAVWRKATADLAIPEVAPARLGDVEVWGVGSNTPD